MNNECAIRKVKDAYGWLGNMSPFSVTWAGIPFHSAEVLFQFLRFNGNLKEISVPERHQVMQSIVNETNPFCTKLIAKKYTNLMVVEPKSEKDVANMEMVLRLKLDQHPDLKRQLIETKDAFIVEDVGNRKGGNHDFWGARKVNGEWIGENTLGKLWMKIRSELV